MLYLPNVMQRNTKHVLNTLLFLALFALITPAANAQLPGPVASGLQVIGYEVNSMAAPPALYTPNMANSIDIWAQNFNATAINLDVGVWVDFNNDGVYASTELIYMGAIALPPNTTNSGVASTSGTTIIMPNIALSNITTKIALLPVGSTNLSNQIVSAETGGTSSADLTLMAVVQDDINKPQQEDCPLDNQFIEIETDDGDAPTLNAARSGRKLDLSAFDLSNTSNNVPVPFTLVTHIVAIDQTGSPKVVPSGLFSPQTSYFANNSPTTTIDYDYNLDVIYFPIGTEVFEVHYYVEDQSGNPMPIKNPNSQIGIYMAFQSWDIIICEENNPGNPNLTPSVLSDILNGNIELFFETSSNGRQAFVQLPQEANPGIVFPNPSTDHTYLQIASEQAAKINWQILNMQGQQVSENRMQAVKAGTYTIDLGTQHLSPGIYVCQYMINGQVYQQRFAKQ